ncbi:hypothetical protein EJB05_35153, partial [Eragrostis curvula]
MAKISPLHRVIDAGRWDTERPLGRLFVVVHAAFLDAGFVLLPSHPSDKRRPIPREAGRTASALSLRYTVPELLRRRRGAQAAVVLRQQVCGRKIILYVQRGDTRPLASSWVAVDVFAAVALVSGGLDVTARALRRDARLAVLWRWIRDALCRRALVDLCRSNGVALEPTFVSLPGDVMAAILARLADGADLARVVGTCAALRQLVAEHDREFWKPMYDALPPAASYTTPDGADASPEETSWKQRYLRARRRYEAVVRTPLSLNERVGPTRRDSYFYRLLSRYLDKRLNRRPRRLDSCNPPEVPADPVPERPRRRRRTAGTGWRAAGIGRVPRSRGQDQEEWRHSADVPLAPSSSRFHEKHRHGAGVVHAPSSRYRWKHR